MFCGNCGKEMPDGINLCDSCGVNKIEWYIRVPIFRDATILKQLGVAVGIPFGLLIMILVIVSGEIVYTLYALGLIGALLVLTWLFVMTVYGGKYDAEFVLDDKGTLCRTQAKQAKKII